MQNPADNNRYDVISSFVGHRRISSSVKDNRRKQTYKSDHMKFILKLIILFTIINPLFGQHINSELPYSINQDGSAPELTAILDLKSSSKGVLIPRMSSIEKNAINSPALGLLLFDTTLNFFQYWDGVSWQSFVGPTGPAADTILNTINDQLIQPVSPNDNLVIGNNSGLLLRYGNIDHLGKNNTFIGHKSGSKSEAVFGNTYVGSEAGENNRSNKNTYIGGFAGGANEFGYDNVFIGYNSGNAPGFRNTYVGSSSGQGSSGNENVFLGYLTGFGSSGSMNVFLGNEAGNGESNSNRLYISNSNTPSPLIYCLLYTSDAADE